MPEYLFERKPQGKRWVMWKIVLVIVTCIILVSAISIGAIYFYDGRLVATKKNDDLCLTENCLKAAVHIASSLDPFKDPCHDFYEFTCGNFIAKAYETNNPSRYYALRVDNLNKLNAIIAEPITAQEQGLLLEQKIFYQSCMNVDAIDEEGLEPFKKLLWELGGWPIVEGQQWKQEDFELSNVILKCKKLGLPFQWFFKMTFNELWYELYIDPPDVVKQYNDSYKESAYFNLMIESAIAFGASNIQNHMKKVFKFEKDLEAIAASTDSPVRSVQVLNELDSLFPIISWLQLINNITENYTISENDTVVITNEVYLRKLNLLLGQTPKRVQANYVIWKILQEFGSYLSTPMRHNFLNFTNFMTRQEKQLNNRFKFCVKEAITRFPRIAEVEFLRRYINKDKVEAIKEIILGIKEQFINRLNAADWIDEITKEAGINKVKNIVDVIGDRNFVLDDDAYNSFLKLSDLQFTSNNIINIVREKNIDEYRQQFKREVNPEASSLTDFLFSNTLNINGAYFELSNIIFITAGIIQDIFHAPNRPNYLNYGAVGAIIGHEIAHAFNQLAGTQDSEEIGTIMSWNESSLQAIEEVDFSNTTTPLWQNESVNILKSKIDCIIRDFKDFKKTVNDEQVIVENVADIIGIDIAYEAYTSWAEQYEEEQHLPGVPFSPKQLFWIQFGALNCYRRLDSLEWSIKEDTHASLRYRVLNPLKNSRNFAKDFDCPEGSVMNPIEKCRVF